MGYWYLRRRKETVESDVDEELKAHLELRIEELRARGLSREEAEREALRLFGDLERTRRYCRRQDEHREDDVQRTLMFQDFMQDLRIGFRSLMRVPVLSLTIIVTVGLGIGATAAIFSAIDAALLRPLPYASPDALVRIYTDTPPFKFRFSVVDYLALEEQQTQFAQIAAYTDRAMTFSTGATAELLQGRLVTWPFFNLLGVRPVLGRDFTEADGRPGNPQALIATHGFWQQRLGARSDVIGTAVELDGADYTVVGVLPPMVGPLERRRDFFIALQLTQPKRKGPFFYTTIARLRDPANQAAAAEELRAINRRLFPIWKSSYQDDKSTWSMEDLKVALVGNVNTIAGLSLAAVALVWLIACANASNLLIARVTSRRQELAVRAALGASRGRVVRYLLAESAVLAAGAVILGTAIAWAGIQLLQGVGATYLPRTQEIAIDGSVMAMLAGLAATSAIIFGLVPALHGTGGSVESALKSLGRTSTGTVAVRQLRRVLVGAQFAIATPLLIVAGLLLTSLNELRRVDLGFDTRNVVTASVRLAPALYSSEGAVNSFWDELRRRINALPGVTGVTYADGRPPSEVGNFNNFDLEQFPTQPGQSQPVTPWVATTPEYFKVLGLPLIEGRYLTEEDAQREQLESVIVDRAWARRFFPHESAVGKRFREGGCTTCPWTAVVGVVSEVKYAGLDQPDQGTVYTPFNGGLVRYLVIRSEADATAMVSSIRQTVRELDPHAPLSQIATMDDLVARSIEQPRSLSVLVGSFAGVALLLSIVGIYGVMGYFVQQHLKDISIRIALGGSSSDVLRLVVGHGMKVVVAGVVAGVLASLALTRLMQSLLFQVSAANVWTFAAVSAAMVLVALLACLLPARRALGLQPAAVLRID